MSGGFPGRWLGPWRDAPLLARVVLGLFLVVFVAAVVTTFVLHDQDTANRGFRAASAIVGTWGVIVALDFGGVTRWAHEHQARMSLRPSRPLPMLLIRFIGVMLAVFGTVGVFRGH